MKQGSLGRFPDFWNFRNFIMVLGDYCINGFIMLAMVC